MTTNLKENGTVTTESHVSVALLVVRASLINAVAAIEVSRSLSLLFILDSLLFPFCRPFSLHGISLDIVVLFTESVLGRLVEAWGNYCEPFKG